MSTTLDLIKGAFRQSGILTKNENPTANEAQDALDSLNELIDSWANTTNFAFERVTESFPLSSGVQTYTIGSGATFNTVRPLNIVEAHVRQANTDYPLDIVPDSVYQSVVYKTTGGIPELLNYTNEFPLGTINLYPKPDTGYSLFITSEKPLATYSSLTDVVSLPPGWKRALRLNLVMEIASEYGQPVPQNIERKAAEAKAMLSLNAIKNNPLVAQPGSNRQINNVYSGYYT